MNIHIRHIHAKGAVADQAALEQFQQQWATYQKLVDTDSLSHKEVGAILHQALAAIAKPFAFVDIACGDAGQMRRALADTPLSRHRSVGAGAGAGGQESGGRVVRGRVRSPRLRQRADPTAGARRRRLVRAVDPPPLDRGQA